MMGRRTRTAIGSFFAIATMGIGMLSGPHAYGAQLSNRALKPSNSSAGATNVTYDFSFGIATAGTLGSIEFQFCANDPIIGDACVAPVGLNVLNASLVSQSGATGFTIAGTSTVNDLLLSRTPAAATAGPVEYVFGNVANPSAEGSYYVRLLTYATADGSGPLTDKGGIGFATNSAVSVSAQVPPFLLFCVGASITAFDCSTATNAYVDLGALSPTATEAATTQLVVATNGQNGYGVWVNGTTLTSGNNTIPALATNSASQTGVSQFGLNLVANATPQVGADVQGPGTGTVTANYAAANRFRFVPGDEVASAAHADDYRKYTVSYIVNVAKAQPPGVYVNTLTYVATANF